MRDLNNQVLFPGYFSLQQGRVQWVQHPPLHDCCTRKRNTLLFHHWLFFCCKTSPISTGGGGYPSVMLCVPQGLRDNLLRLGWNILKPALISEELYLAHQMVETSLVPCIFLFSLSCYPLLLEQSIWLNLFYKCVPQDFHRFAAPGGRNILVLLNYLVHFLGGWGKVLLKVHRRNCRGWRATSRFSICRFIMKY